MTLSAHCRFCAASLQTTVNGEVFKVGSNAENYRVREIAQTIAAVFPGCEVSTEIRWSDAHTAPDRVV